MTEPAPPSCLLIMPRGFHLISRTFAATLGELGFAVTEANDDYPENALGKILSKLDLSLARWLTRRTIKRRFLDGRRWNLVLIVKGRGVGAELVADLKSCADRVVGYHFDALAYDRATIRWTRGVDRVTTFDYRDAKERGWPLVELFSTSSQEELRPILYRFSAIMRNHSQRLAFVDRVFAGLGCEQSFVYIFEKSLAGAMLNLVRNPLIYWRWRRHIHLAPLDPDRYAEVMAGSDFTLDYAHPLQSGATMRSFEALALGVKLITNNPHPSAESRYFGPHNSIVCEGRGASGALRDAVERLAGTRPPAHRRGATEFMREVLGKGDALGGRIDTPTASQ